MAKTVKKNSRRVKVDSGFTVPQLLGLAILLGLLCVLPWATNLDGSDNVHALQLVLALLLALAGGFCLGLQVASRKK